MYNRKTDKRTIETKSKIVKSLSILLKDKDISRITVRELSDAVGIHRTTFYAHYTDVYEVYEELLNQIFYTTTEFLSSEDIVSYHDFYEKIIQYMWQNKDFSKMIFTSDAMITQLQSFFEIGCISTWQEENAGFMVTSSTGYYAAYRVSGVIAILKKWVLGNYELPAPQILEMITALDCATDEVIINKH